jgi:hypothetical protein
MSRETWFVISQLSALRSIKCRSRRFEVHAGRASNDAHRIPHHSREAQQPAGFDQ